MERVAIKKLINCQGNITRKYVITNSNLYVNKLFFSIILTQMVFSNKSICNEDIDILKEHKRQP